jgi:hypothetical protein
LLVLGPTARLSGSRSVVTPGSIGGRADIPPGARVMARCDWPVRLAERAGLG